VSKPLVKDLRKIGWFLGSAWKFFILQKLSDMFWGPLNFQFNEYRKLFL
jgi:hypothetical protein